MGVAAGYGVEFRSPLGYAAAAGTLGAEAWVLYAILFIWQFPHFYAIAWMYRDDYRRGGLRMLPVVDHEGTTTARMVLLYTLALIPVSLMAFGVRPVGWLYPVGAVLLGATNRDLELPGQEGEFRVQGGPLADDFAIRPWIFDLIGCDACQMVRGHIAHAVTAGLDCMHLHCCQIGKDVRNTLQSRPIVLYVLAGGEVSVAFVIFAGNLGQHAHLLA